ncbi:MAG: sigma-70 family RNA polymerase sigma factor [Burkholderiales bacterium]|nr:sigma-70 family RNA polymerase sigma factor [Burkholderiales bacterium]
MSQESNQPKRVQFDGAAESSALWRAFKSENDPAVREEIIDRYFPFARIMAAKAYANRVFIELEFCDFMQYASVGLIESIDRFDPDRGVKFETFSAPRITGAILNGIESLSEKQEQVSARRRIVAGRLDTLKEKPALAQDPEALFGYLADIAIGLAVGFVLEDSGMYQADEASYPDNSYTRVELQQLHQQIKSLLELLPPNERRVLNYHYLHHVPFEEIAKIFGVTKGRISQIHKDALKRLRTKLRGDRLDLNC